MNGKVNVNSGAAMGLFMPISPEKWNALVTQVEAISEKLEDLTEVNEYKLTKGEYMTAKQAMEYLNIGRTTFESWRKEGIIKTYQLASKGKVYVKALELKQAFREMID